MAKIIVAFTDRQLNRQIAALLEGAGFEVFRSCATGNEVMRAFNQCQDGILLCGPRFADRTADQLAYDLGARALILVVGKPEALELCEHPDIFRLVLPASKSDLTASVNLLEQLHYKRMPHRSADEKRVIDEAKRRLIERHSMTEAEAHRMLQQISMREGIKMIESARRVLEAP